MIRMALIILCGWIFGGCASVMHTASDGHPNRQDIAVPAGASVVMLDEGKVVDDDQNGWVRVNRGAGPLRGNVGRIEKNGQMVAVVRSRVSWWIAGNYVYGYFPGLMIDFIGGSAFEPRVVYIKSDAQVLKEIEASTKPKS